MDESIISNSFHQCGVTSNTVEDYHAQLSYYIKTNELVDIIEESDINPIGAYETKQKNQ